MRSTFCIAILLVLALSAGFVFAEVQLMREGDEDISAREIKRIEKVLSKDFPMKILRKRAQGRSKAIAARIVYFPLRQRSKLYVLAVSTGKWSDYASRFAIYRIYKDSIVRIYTSRSWQANYAGYSFDAAQVGKDNIILFKEGVGDEDRYSLASVIMLGQGKRGLYIRDLTPRLSGLSVKVAFPFRPLYAKGITLLVQEGATLTASDGFTATTRWAYNQATRHFESEVRPVISSK